MSQPIEDLSPLAEPKSDQLNADDLIGGPITVTVTGVVHGPDAQQAVEIQLAGHKPYRPCKSMRRVLIAVWGPRPAEWPPQARMTLYRDPGVKFGGMEVGGIRISHMSGIDQPVSLALTVTRAKRMRYTVQPLAGEERPRAPKPISERLRGLVAWCEAQGLAEHVVAAVAAAAPGRGIGELDDAQARAVFDRLIPLYTQRDALGEEE